MEEKNITGYYNVSPKENLYFAIRVTLSLLIYVSIISALVIFTTLVSPQSTTIIIALIACIAALYLLQNGLFIGLIQSQSVKIGEHQFPEIYKIVCSLSRSLNINKVPKTYLIQSGGGLNAFAKKFMGSNYVVIYSDLLEAYYEGDMNAVEFVIAHELGHIKRHHFWKSLLILPTALIPFLPQAYNRACETTCDNIGKFFNPRGAVDGLLILAGGKKLAREINVLTYINQQETDGGFWRWFSEKLISHPALYKRLSNVYSAADATKREVNYTEKPAETTAPSPIQETETVQTQGSDYSRYMPN